MVERQINEKRLTRETLVLSFSGDPQKSDALDLDLILETERECLNFLHLLPSFTAEPSSRRLLQLNPLFLNSHPYI